MNNLNTNTAPSLYLLKILFNKLNKYSLTDEERKEIINSINFLLSLKNGILENFSTVEIRENLIAN